MKVPKNRAFVLTHFCFIVLIVTALTLIPETKTSQAGWFQRAKKVFQGSKNSDTGVSNLTTGEIGSGLKEALRVGTERVVGQLGKTDGFNADPAIHIPLPGSLQTVKSALSKVGMSSLLDDLELRLNRAAEVATPKAKELFWQAIAGMTLDDARAIYKGPDDAATRYFQKKLTKPLSEEMQPIVEKSLSEVGAVQSYDQAMGKYRSLPFVPDVKANLSNYVVEKGLDGIFYYLAKEEAAIRKNPVKRTTELLKRVFGNK